MSTALAERIPTPEQVTILMSGEKGAGEILKQVREHRGWSQGELAQRLNVSRIAVTHWESEKRWPKGDNLDKLMIALAPASTIVRDKRLEARVTQQELSQILNELDRAGKDEIDRADALITYAYPRVLSTLILRATAAPGVVTDAKSIGLFFEHRKEIRDEKRRRGSEQVRTVTTQQPTWASGDVYEQPQPPQDVVDTDEPSS